MGIASQLSFSTATSVRGGALGSIPYQSATSSTVFVSIGAAGTVLRSNGTAPIWAPAGGTTVGTSTQVNTVLQTASNAYYLTFVDSNNAVSTAEAVYTTSTFTINPATGFVGIGAQDGASPLNVRALSTLSGTINSFQRILTTQASGGLGNNVYRTEWRRRRAAGTDWTTQNIHDGIWVDASFTTPGTDTRTWWERDPNTTSQAWGDQATTWMSMNGTGIGIGVAPATIAAPLTFVDSLATKIQLNGNSANSYTIGKAAAVASGDSLFKFVAGATAAGEFGFYNTTNLRMIITAAGRLGVGLAAPGSILETEENTTGTTEVRITNSNTGSNTTKQSRLTFRITDTVGTRKDVAYITALPINADSSNGNHLAFFTRTADATPTEKLRITNNGGISFGATGTAYGTAGQILQSNGDAAPTWVPVSGTTVGTSTRVTTLLRTTAASHFLTFVDSNNASATAETVYTTSSVQVNPGTGLTTLTSLSVDGVYNSPQQTISLTLGTESWVKLATLGNRCFAVFRVSVGSNNSEEDSEIEIAGNYVLTPSAITVKRMTYNGHLREVRIVQSAGGAAKVIYIRVRTNDFAPSVQWRLINTQGFSTIHNIVETPAAGESLLVVNNVEHVTSYNSTVRSLGVGTTSSAVVGEIRAANEITAYYSSDIRLKENIRLISDPITIVNQIRGVYYDWTDEHIRARGGEDGYFVRKHDIGVIAQEVEAVLPEIVATRDDGTKVVKYEKLVALLIEAVKEQQKQINQISQALEKMAIK
jgi:hypothetical protein